MCERRQEAGVFAQILAPWAMIWFVATILSLLIYILEIQEFGLKYNILNLGSRFLSLLIGGLLGNVYLALFLFMISGICVYGYIGYIALTQSGASIRKVGHIVFKPILFAVVMTFGVYILSLTSLPKIVLCCIAILCGLLYFGSLLCKSELIKSYIH